MFLRNGAGLRPKRYNFKKGGYFTKTDTFDPSELIRELNSHQNVFICGPSYGETHLRVYANGGRLCLIPTTSNSEIRTTFFDSQNGYLKYVPDEFHQELKKNYTNAFTNTKGKTRKDINTHKGDFLKNYLPMLCNAIEEKFHNKISSAEENPSVKERHIQTSIARNHRDFQRHHGTVVCDFEMTAPKEWYRRGSKLLEIEIPKEKNPKCDLVTFSCTQNPWVISIIELKCNRSACINKKSGLSSHAREMAICMKETETIYNQTDYIQEILRRLWYMLHFGLLDNAPEGLEAQIKALYESSNREQIRKQVHLRSCFLFTEGLDIPDAETAANLCCETDYLQKHLEDFSYQFQKASKVDLSQMQNWKDFSKS